MGAISLQVAFGFAISIFLVHVLLWQFRRPKAQMRGVLALFLTLSLAGCSLLLLEWANVIAWWLPTLSIMEIFRVAFFLVAFSLAYFVAYSAIASDSPTILLNFVVNRAMPDGIAENDLAKQGFDMDAFYQSRLQQLLENGMVEQVEDGYQLGASGKRFLDGILRYRQLLQTPLEVD